MSRITQPKKAFPQYVLLISVPGVRLYQLITHPLNFLMDELTGSVQPCAGHSVND
jgi:hypothetical protein